jgi:hypothetical protein
MPRKPTDIVQINLRIRERLRARLEREAEKSNDSLNAEMINRLEESFAEEDRLSDVFGSLENPALFRLAMGEIALMKQGLSKHMPDDEMALQATTKVLAAIARHVLPAARWVEVTVGPEKAERAYKYFAPTATLAGNFFDTSAKGSKK